MQAIGEELFFYQPAVEFIFQLGDAERRQLWRQQAQDIIALLNTVNLLWHRSGLAYQCTKGFHRRIFFGTDLASRERPSCSASRFSSG